MSIFASLFGGAKAGEKIIDSVASGIDKIWHTAEEKAEDAATARREGFQVYMSWLESTSGSRIARRLIAMIVTSIWALEHIASVIMGVTGTFADDGAKFTQSSQMLAEHANNNNALVGVVLLFYFGGPAAIDGVKGLVNKWTTKPEPQK